MPTPAPSPSSRYSFVNRAVNQIPPCGSRSVHGWSEALLNDYQAFPNLEDVRGAICQMRCPEKSKEKMMILSE